MRENRDNLVGWELSFLFFFLSGLLVTGCAAIFFRSCECMFEKKMHFEHSSVTAPLAALSFSLGQISRRLFWFVGLLVLLLLQFSHDT